MQQREPIFTDKFTVVGVRVADQEKIARPSLNFWNDVWLTLMKNKGAMVGLIIAGMMMILAIMMPMISPYTYKQQNMNHQYLPPRIPILEKVPFLGVDGTMKDISGSGKVVKPYQENQIKEYHFFGTDEFGRDIWTRTWYGARVSLMIAFLAAIIDVLIGVTFGGISGFFGGKIDLLMQRIIEILIGIPYLIVVILFMIIFEKPSILTLTLAMVVTGWTSMARIVRGQFLKMKNQEYVMAARTLGASNISIIFKHLVPNILGAILISMMFTIPNAIFTEAFLSFLGLGISPPIPSLGTMVNDGVQVLEIFPYMLIIPAFAISILILSFNLLADGLRDALDPKMRK